MGEPITIELELPDDLERLNFPPALDSRLQGLLDKQDQEGSLSAEEQEEAKSLVEVSELVSLLRPRATRARNPPPAESA